MLHRLWKSVSQCPDEPMPMAILQYNYCDNGNVHVVHNNILLSITSGIGTYTYSTPPWGQSVREYLYATVFVCQVRCGVAPRRRIHPAAA